MRRHVCVFVQEIVTMFFLFLYLFVLQSYALSKSFIPVWDLSESYLDLVLTLFRDGVFGKKMSCNLRCAARGMWRLRETPCLRKGNT